MDRKPIKSSNIRSVGWKENVLEVEFTNGTIYQYDGVTENLYNYMMESESVGKFFAARIKGGGYTSTKVDQKS